MAIVADLYDLSAAEFLLMLSLNRKSGRLEGVNGDRKVMLAFREGSIVYAGSTEVRERLGSILVSRKLVTEEQLQAALQRHTDEGQTTLLGNILVENGAISRETLTEVVGSQFQRVVAELLSWENGQLTFLRVEIPDLGAIPIDPRSMLIDLGFDTEHLVLGGMSSLEDSHRDTRVDNDEIRTMIDEMAQLSVTLTAEATLEILSAAADHLDRCVLMMVGSESVYGIGGSGVEVQGVSADIVVRNCVVPKEHESIFAWVIEHRSVFRGPLVYNPCHGLFVDQLGGAKPEEVVAIPLTVNGEVVAVLYGDNAISGQPVTDVALLRELMERVGSSLEHAT